MSPTKPPTAELPATLRRTLAQLAGPGGLLTDPADRWPYGYDNSQRHRLPAAVFFVTDAAQVAPLLRLAGEAGLPVTARGRGTGTTGATVPTAGGLVVSFERLAQIRRIHAADRLAIVEPGVINATLQRELAGMGLFWPPDPSSAAACTIGGNLAHNSAGPRSLKYGTPRECTLGLRAVTGAGEVIRTGVLTSKGVVGYDLTRLLIGSEGTLALTTEATLRLTPLPEARRTLRAIYRDSQAAAAAVAAIMAQPVTPCALEMMDAAALEAVRRYRDPGVPSEAGALLMIEVDGTAAGIDAAAAAVTEAARQPGLIDIRAATEARGVAELWQIRTALAPSLRHMAPHRINEDVVVPVSRLGALVEGLGRLAREHRIRIVNFGHAGNGNLHVSLLVDPEDPAEMARAMPCLSAVFDLVLALEGTLSGEHGVGLAKRSFVARELDPAALALMRGIKRQFDPSGILNPDKTLP